MEDKFLSYTAVSAYGAWATVIVALVVLRYDTT